MDKIVLTRDGNKYTSPCPEEFKKFGFKDVLEFFPEEEDENMYRCTGFISGEKYVEYHDEIKALLEVGIEVGEYVLSFGCNWYSKEGAVKENIIDINLYYTLEQEDEDIDGEPLDGLLLQLDWTPAIMRIFNKNWTTPTIDQFFQMDAFTEFIQEAPCANKYVAFADIDGEDLIESEVEIKELLDHPVIDATGNVITFHVVYESVTPEVYFDNSIELEQLYSGPNSPDFSSDEFQVRLEAILVPRME